MKVIIVFSLLISFQNQIPAQDYSHSEVTLNVHERVELLKRQIYQEINQDRQELGGSKIKWDRGDKSDEFDDNYVYKDTDNQPITPIMDFDERKEKGRFHHKQLVTKHPTTFVAIQSKETFDIKPLRTKRRKKNKAVPLNKPEDIFYRRWEGLSKQHNTELRWMHCHDLLTPYFMNTKDPNDFKILTVNDTLVLRLIHLLSVNTVESTKDEIYSILYQISNIPIRLFQWDIPAIAMLFDQVIQDTAQNFRTLKKNIKNLFAKWHLDIGNVTNLLKQSRIFRPPCIQTSALSGSTRTSKGLGYTRTKEPKTTCTPSPSNEYDSCE